MNAKRTTLGLLMASMACGLLVSGSVYGQTETSGKSDPRVRQQLDKIGWKYEIDRDGDYKLVFRHENGRTQLIFVRSRTNEIGGLEVREVWSPGVIIEESVSAELATDLLCENHNVKIGAWRLMPQQHGYVAVFSVTVGADADAGTLATAVQAAGTTADEKEKAVHGTDKL
jgi:hypothetical protein